MTDPSAGSQEHHQTVRTIALGTIWRILRYPFVILSAIIIPRLMGPSVYGRFAYFMSIYLMLDILTDVGITQVFGRFIPELKSRGQNEVSHFLHGILFYGVLITAGVIVFIAWPLYVSGRVDFKPIWWLVLCLLLLTTKIAGTLFAFLYGANQIGRYSSKELIRSAATFVFVLVLFYFFGLVGALWALLLNEIVLLITVLCWTHGHLFRKVTRVSFSQFKPYLVFGVKFFIPMLLFSFLQRCGNVFVKELSGSYEEVGFFDVANQFMLLTATFLGLLIATLLPALTSLYIKDEHETIDRWHRNVMTYCGVVVFLAFNTLVTIGKPVIITFLKASFASVHGNALILCLAMVPILVVYAGMNFAILDKKSATYTWGVLGGLVVMAVACICLVPRMKAIGASWATVLGYLFPAVLFCVKYRRRFASILGGLIKALLAGLPVVPLYFFGFEALGPVVTFVVTTVVYIAVLMVFRIVLWSDARKIWEALTK